MVLGLLLTQRPGIEVRSRSLWRAVTAEVVGSCILMFSATTVGMRLGEHDQPVPLLWPALSAGVVLFVLIETLGHVSGACVNPAVVILFLVTKVISPLRAGLYFVADCVGGIFGSALAYSVAPAAGRAALTPISLAPGVSLWAGVVCETFVAHTMCLVVLGASDHRRRTVYMAGLPIGLSVTAGVLACGRISGGAMNPLISLGPSVVTGNFYNHWIYWLGPCLGALIAALEYNLVFAQADGQRELPQSTTVETVIGEKFPLPEGGAVGAEDDQGFSKGNTGDIRDYDLDNWGVSVVNRDYRIDAGKDAAEGLQRLQESSSLSMDVKTTEMVNCELVEVCWSQDNS